MRIEHDVPVRMRDGVILRANLFRPAAPGRFPALVMRTPYGKPSEGYAAFVRAGYAVLAQDTRGRYASDGVFTVFSEPHTGDAEDGYDTVEWAASQPWCNGKVGTFGVSYCAWMQYQLARLRPPHLKAMSAMSIPPELTDLDWPGAFRPGRRIRWWITTIAPDLRRRQGLPPPHTPAEAERIWTDIEKAGLLGLMPWSRIVDLLPEPLAGHVAEWLREPGRRPWRFDQAHRDIAVPNLDVTGWFDHACSIAHLAGMQHNARTRLARAQTKVVIGPWNHMALGFRKQGVFDFGPQAEVGLDQLRIRWFDRWLKDTPNGVERESAVRYFVMGSNEWKSAPSWPPPGLTRQTLFLASRGDAGSARGGALIPSGHGSRQADTFVSDPNQPVPTLWDPACFYGASDRRKLDYRTDILRYRTPPLTRDVEVVGHPEVVLHVAVSAPDADCFVRLADEDPAGPALEVCYGMIRARHRNGLDHEDLLVPGQPVELRIRMGMTACCFRKGHRIRLEVCAGDFPNHDRNHQVGRNDFFDAEMAVADVTVFHSVTRPSRLILPVSPHAR
jgi:hypothetical protein